MYIIYLDMQNTHETDNTACLQGSKFESLVAGDRIGSFFIHNPLHLLNLNHVNVNIQKFKREKWKYNSYGKAKYQN